MKRDVLTINGKKNGDIELPSVFNTEINQENSNHTSPSVFEKTANGKSTEIVKEPEMFDEPGLEEDFEIPAFLRKQKN